MLLSDLVDIERDPPSEYTALVKFEHFSRLSDDLIGRILYSGYLPRVWNEIVPLLLINKHFMELGKRYISFIDFKSKPWHEAHGGTYSDNVLNAYRIAHNLVHLDLSYTNVNFQLPAIREGFMQWQHSLRGLNLRGTTVEDDFCEIIGHFQHLVYLDVSKVTASQAEWISDEGGAHLVKLKKLRWFCAGSTSITDKTIVLLQKHCKEVNHLVIPACAGLTNEGLACLKSMPLNVLDISNCPLINAEGIKELLSPSSELSRNLEIFMCSFLNAPRAPLLNALCSNFSQLRQFEMRCRADEALDADLVAEIKKKFEVAILNHKDQLCYPHIQSIIPFCPPVEKICTIFTWPYLKPGL